MHSVCREFCCKQNRAHTGSHTYAIGDNVALHEIQSVVDCHAIRYASAGRVDVQMNILLGVFHLKEKKLGNNGISHIIVNGGADEDDAVTKQSAVDVPSSFLATFAFINIRGSGK